MLAFLISYSNHFLIALRAAETALKNIKKSDIVEMKSMLKPPEAIRMTMAAICIMLKQKPDKKGKPGDPYDGYWITATKEVRNLFIENREIK